MPLACSIWARLAMAARSWPTSACSASVRARRPEPGGRHSVRSMHMPSTAMTEPRRVQLRLARRGRRSVRTRPPGRCASPGRRARPVAQARRDGGAHPAAVLGVLVAEVGLGVRGRRAGRQSVQGEHLRRPPPGAGARCRTGSGRAAGTRRPGSVASMAGPWRRCGRPAASSVGRVRARAGEDMTSPSSKGCRRRQACANPWFRRPLGPRFPGHRPLRCEDGTTAGAARRPRARG